MTSMLENNSMIHKIKSLFFQYKYIVLIIVVGTVLLLWPSSDPKSDDGKTSEKITSYPVSNSVSDVEEALEEILETVKDVGRVEVFLSLEQEYGTEYALNTNSSSLQNSTNGQKTEWDQSVVSNVVTVRDAAGNESVVVKSTSAPVYRGALIVCDGGDDAAIKLTVTKAVSSLLGLGTDSILVVKMKK